MRHVQRGILIVSAVAPLRWPDMWACASAVINSLTMSNQSNSLATNAPIETDAYSDFLKTCWSVKRKVLLLTVTELLQHVIYI